MSLPAPDQVPGMEAFAQAVRASRRPNALSRRRDYRLGLCPVGLDLRAEVVLHGDDELAAFASEMVRLGYAPVRLPGITGYNFVYARDADLTFQASRV